ncbi:MAG TPA: ATP-binding protein [Vicinamibacterales bacterium]
MSDKGLGQADAPTIYALPRSAPALGTGFGDSCGHRLRDGRRTAEGSPPVSPTKADDCSGCLRGRPAPVRSGSWPVTVALRTIGREGGPDTIGALERLRYVCCLEIHGRQREAEILDRFLTTAGHRGVRLLLEGEPGIGKTTLWRYALDRATDFRILVSRPAEADGSLAYAGLVDLLEPSASEVLARLPAPQREALEVALLRTAAAERAPDPRAVFTAFSTTLQLLAAETPVLVAVDDLQWLDPPSARALGFAARRIGEARIGVLAAVRRGAGAAPDWFDSQERVRLEPLPAGTLHALVKERLGWSEFDIHGHTLTIYAPIVAGVEDIHKGACSGNGCLRVRHDGKTYEFDGSDCFIKAFGRYTWAVAGNTLTIRLVHDPCVTRRAIFPGTWTMTG